MKQKDVALIIIIVAISGFASFFVSKLLFASGSHRQLKVEQVDVITTDFQKPSSKYFNINSVDPTQLIQISQTNNQNPFNGTSQ